MDFQNIDDEESELAIAVIVMGYVLLSYAALQHMRPRRRYWVHPINRKRDDEGEFATFFTQCVETSHDQFFMYTRMEVWQWTQLLDILRPALTKRSIRKPIPPELRLALTLKYLAHGGSIQSLAWSYRIGRTSARKIILETCSAIWDMFSGEFVKIPASKEEWRKIAVNFWELWNFPNCIGAIDGKHIAIKAPYNCGCEYYCYKGFNSIVLMAACDARYQFTWVDVGAIGSKSDGGIFSESSFGKALMQEKLDLPEACLPGTDYSMPHWFVADEAFPLKENIMRPYPGRELHDHKKIFNYRLSRARRTIENAFGILAARWQIYQGKFSGAPETVEKLVLATVCLHNFIMASNQQAASRYCPDKFVDHEENGCEVPGGWRELVHEMPHHNLGRLGSNNPTRAVAAVRDLVSNYLIEEGEVSWQYDHINKGWSSTS